MSCNYNHVQNMYPKIIPPRPPSILPIIIPGLRKQFWIGTISSLLLGEGCFFCIAPLYFAHDCTSLEGR